MNALTELLFGLLALLVCALLLYQQFGPDDVNSSGGRHPQATGTVKEVQIKPTWDIVDSKMTEIEQVLSRAERNLMKDS